MIGLSCGGKVLTSIGPPGRLFEDEEAAKVSAAMNPCRGFFCFTVVIFRGRVGVRFGAYAFSSAIDLPMPLARVQQNEANKRGKRTMAWCSIPL
jgi:hypothetical protein